MRDEEIGVATLASLVSGTLIFVPTSVYVCVVSPAVFFSIHHIITKKDRNLEKYQRAMEKFRKMIEEARKK